MADGEPVVPIPDRPNPLERLLRGGGGGGAGLGLGFVDRRRLTGIAVAGVVLVAAAVAGYLLLLRTPAAPPIEQRLPFAGAASGSTTTVPGPPGAPGTPGAPGSATSVPTELVVHAAGAVAVPGVHRVPAGSRVADLLAAAGGPAADADLDRVNLAAALVDGERVWFPRVGEEAPPAVAGSPAGPAGSPGSPGGTTAAPGPVDVNTATVEELDALPGIGPAIAAAIVEHRERAGRFRTVDDLLDVPGIGDAKLAQLRDLVVAG